MIFRIFFFFYLAASFEYSAATTITSSQDGNWEDSSTWDNNQPLSNTPYGDTIIISHHINFNHDLLLSHCYLRVDTLASLCGHDSIHLYYSTVYEYGGCYADFVWIETSYWYSLYGYWVFIYGFRLTAGPAGFHNCCGAGGHTAGGFICTIPVQSWKDTTQVDTTHNDTIHVEPPPPPPLPISISVYPNPSLDHFTIDSEIPDSNSQVTLNIYDLLGRKMKTISIPPGKSSLTIFSNNWAAGMYLLRFEQGDIIIQTDKIVRVQ